MIFLDNISSLARLALFCFPSFFAAVTFLGLKEVGGSMDCVYRFVTSPGILHCFVENLLCFSKCYLSLHGTYS